MELKIEFEAHAAAEECYLYCSILMGDNGLSPSRHALSEHHEIEALLEELSVTRSRRPPGKPRRWSSATGYDTTSRKKIGAFQQAGKLLTERQKTALAGKCLRDLQRMKKRLSA